MSKRNQRKIYLSWLFATLTVLGFIISQTLAGAKLLSAENDRWLERGADLALCDTVQQCVLKNTALQIPKRRVISNSRSQEKQKVANNGQWRSVPIGGGAYVTGIYAHPQVADLIYMQTDNGGAYRWQPKQQRWQNIIDSFPRLPWNYYGVEALALDPQNPELVYLGLGKYTDGGNGKLWKSSDRGQTWIESDLWVPMGADEDKRWAGNRLAVSPHNGNNLLFGSRLNGLWRSTDGGLHWLPVESLQTANQSKLGIITVAFDPQDERRIYAGAYGDGIYRSNDAGSTWKKMSGSPSQMMKMVVASDRSLYVTSDAAPGVSKWSNGVWQDITPPLYRKEVFNALSVDARDGDRLLVALGETGNAKIFYSTNGGQTWQEKSARPQASRAVPWWKDRFFSDHTSAVIFDPHHPERIWLSDWFGVWRTDNFGDRQPTWTNYPQGQEQLVTFSLLAPPKGAVLLSGVADVEGFYHHSLHAYPQNRLSQANSPASKIDLPWDSYWQDTYSIAYCATQPLNLVRVGGKRNNLQNTGATSADGGLTWQKFTNFPRHRIPLRVAVSATNPQQFVVIRSEARPLQTQNGGKSWQPVSGLPDGMVGPWNWRQPLAADGVDGNKFYYYSAGIFYRSDDGGVTFARVNNSLPLAQDYQLKTVPGKEAEVWLSLDNYGLYFSRDGGNHFKALPQVEQSKLIAFGKAANQKNPWLYLYGKLKTGEEGLFLARDRAQTWQQLDEIPLFGNDRARTLRVLEASQQESGLVFLGTDGRGIYYRNFARRSLD